MIQAKWKTGYGSLHHGADAQLVAEEILAIGEDVTPQQIVDAARNRSSELHKCFTWDNRKAAQKWRLFEARQVVCHLVLQPKEEEDTPLPEVRAFFKGPAGEGYKPATVIFRKENEYLAMLGRAQTELQAFSRKYSILSDLEEMQRLLNTVDRMIQEG